MVLVASGPRGGQVAACCAAAAAQGVRPNMPLAEAQALVRELAIAPHEPHANRQALAKVAEACERFSPCVGLEEGDEPESLLLDISNLEHLWGSEKELVGQIEMWFTSRGYRVRLGVAETVGLAWALAHFGIADFGLRMDYFRQSEIQLPVASLRVADETAALLRELGIETVDQLLALPRAGLASRFGGELLRRLDQLTGAAREVIVPHRSLAALEVGCALDEPTVDRAALTHTLNQLVEQLARQLAARDQGAVLLVCLLKCTGGDTVPLRIGLFEPSANPRQLMELVDLHLETVTLVDEVNRVETRVAIVGQLGERQGELFADGWPSDPQQLAVLVNRLSSRLGYERVMRAELRASAVPERAVRWVPMTERRDKGARRMGDKETSRRKHSPCLPSPRPLLLYPQPHAVEVVCVAPDGPPQFVWLEAGRERIVHYAGPERIETLWWRGPSVRRDYYRIAIESGSHLWVFRRLTDGRWFLHGVFT